MKSHSLDVRVVALDFDGVLVDSVAAKNRAYVDAFERYPEVRRELLRLRLNEPHLNRVEFFDRAHETVWRGAPGAPSRAEFLEAMSDAMVDRVSACPSMEGADRLWRAWPNATMAIVSLTPESDLRRIVRRRGYPVAEHRVFGCPPWSKSRALREILHVEAIPPGAMLVVGDSPSDAVVAGEVGATYRGVGTGSAPWFAV